MGKIYAIMNQKGGVGKTTTALNMASEMVKQGNKVLLMDMDSQGSLTTAMGFNAPELDRTIGDLFGKLIRRELLPDLTNYIVKKDQLELIPANLTLSVADISIVTATAREYLLQKIIRPIKDWYDYIIIDCPPTLGMLVVNVLTAADAVIVPIKATEMDTKGFESLMDTVELIRMETNPNLYLEGVLMTMFDSRLCEAKDALADVEELCAERYVRLFETKISTSTTASRAFRSRKAIADYDSNCSLAQQYTTFVREVLKNEQ